MTIGYLVADVTGRIVGRVECPMYGTAPDVPDALSVRSGFLSGAADSCRLPRSERSTARAASSGSMSRVRQSAPFSNQTSTSQTLKEQEKCRCPALLCGGWDELTADHELLCSSWSFRGLRGDRIHPVPANPDGNYKTGR